MVERALAELCEELERIAPDDWPAVLRTATARSNAAALLAALDRPPSSHSRLGWELRARLRESIRKREAA
jgi:hypothetical protein